MALPSGYTQLSYIQSSGTQYINTGFNPKHNTRVVMKAAYTNVAETQYPYLFGAFDFDFSYALQCSTQTGRFYADYGTQDYISINNTQSFQDNIIDANKNVFSIGDSSISLTVEEFAINYPLYLFCHDRYGGPSYYAVAKMYYCQIYDNGTLVRDYVPCTDSVGVVGLYDLVNRKFYTNAGSGTFSAGEPVGDSGGPIGGAAGATLVAGTAYKVTGGKCLVNGTGYSIKKGRTLVDGTGYDVSFQSGDNGGSGEADFYAVSINQRGIGTPDSSGDICCAVVDGTVYNNASLGAYEDGPVLTVPFGTLITCYVRSANFSIYNIQKDDEYVTTLGDSNKKVLSYSFYVTADTEITLVYRTASLGDAAEYCWITITTS